jgi:hypothetical protein
MDQHSVRGESAFMSHVRFASRISGHVSLLAMQHHYHTEAHLHEIKEEPVWQHANNATGREK